MDTFHADHRLFERDERRGISFVLALAVHLLLVLFLVVSVQWRTQRADTVSVELWGSPPPAPIVEKTVVQTPKPSIEPKIEPAPVPVPEKKPEIVEEKIKPVPKPVEKPKPVPASVPKVEKKPEPKPEPKPAPKKEPVTKPVPQKSEPSLSDVLNQAMNERNKAVTAPPAPNGKAGGTGTNPLAILNATPGIGAGGGGKPGDAYLGQVIRLIKSNLVYPDNRPDNPKAKIKVFLLPDGTIRDAQLLQSVGDPAYAEAARRAVMTTRTFPPQPGGKIFSGDMREWTLSFCAKDRGECKVD